MVDVMLPKDMEDALVAYSEAVKVMARSDAETINLPAYKAREIHQQREDALIAASDTLRWTISDYGEKCARLARKNLVGKVTKAMGGPHG